MRKLINLFYCFAFFSFFLLLSGISKAEEGRSTIASSSRSFNKKNIDHYRSLEEYNYEPVLYDSGDDSFWSLIRRFFSKLFSSNKDGSGVVLNYLIYIVAGGLIVYFLLKLAKADRSWFLYSKAKKPSIEIRTEEENIHEIDLRKIIEEAIASKDFRKAIRFSYLLILKELTDKNLIEWKPEKTNAEYQRELKTSELKPLFEENTLVYEYIWYGNFSIEESEFQKARSSFDKFIAKIKGAK